MQLKPASATRLNPVAAALCCTRSGEEEKIRSRRKAGMAEEEEKFHERDNHKHAEGVRRRWLEKSREERMAETDTQWQTIVIHDLRKRKILSTETERKKKKHKKHSASASKASVKETRKNDYDQTARVLFPPSPFRPHMTTIQDHFSCKKPSNKTRTGLEKQRPIHASESFQRQEIVVAGVRCWEEVGGRRDLPDGTETTALPVGCAPNLARGEATEDVAHPECATQESLRGNRQEWFIRVPGCARLRAFTLSPLPRARMPRDVLWYVRDISVQVRLTSARSFSSPPTSSHSLLCFFSHRSLLVLSRYSCSRHVRHEQGCSSISKCKLVVCDCALDAASVVVWQAAGARACLIQTRRIDQIDEIAERERIGGRPADRYGRNLWQAVTCACKNSTLYQYENLRNEIAIEIAMKFQDEWSGQAGERESGRAERATAEGQKNTRSSSSRSSRSSRFRNSNSRSSSR
eukprot:227676-Hanusia_phi.AAC.1